LDFCKKEEVEDVIRNKVEESGIIQMDLMQLSPSGKRLEFDMKDHLFQGLVLREQPFREFVTNHDWEMYRDAFVHIHCSADAIVPQWAYMLVASSLKGIARSFFWGDRNAMEDALIIQAIESFKEEGFKDKRVMVKGCAKRKVSEAVYIHFTWKLQPWVKSLMFGEPCSSVPVYKKRK
jgi:hypothetical protein